MRQEGRGEIAPAPLQIYLTWNDLRIFRDFAAQVAARRHYARGRTLWQLGLTSGFTVGGRFEIPPHEAGAFIGKVGEYALVYFLNHTCGKEVARLNLDLLPRGDGGKDVIAFGRSIEVVTRRINSPSSLIRRTLPGGKILTLYSDYFMFAEYNIENPLKVTLLGWIRRRELEPMPTVPARRGEHRNIDVKDLILQPMRTLKWELESFSED